MDERHPSASSPRPARVVVGGYSIEPAGDPPDADTGIRVLDLESTSRNGADDQPYEIAGHVALLSPTWVEPHPTRPWLVSVGEAAPSELVCTRLEDDGSLTVLGRRETGGDFGCHLALSADGRQVVVAHYGTGSVESFGLGEDGEITGPRGRFRSEAPLGPDAERQDGPHAHQVVFDPDRDDELLVCDLGTDRIHRLRLGHDGELTEAAPSVVLAPGSGPRHLVIAGDTLVVACELGVDLWVARRTPDGWEHTQTVPTSGRPAAERAASEAPVLPSELRLIDDDRVVVATRGLDTVSVFALDRRESSLARLGEVSCGGHHPRDLVVADGRVWVVNHWSDEIVVLDLAAVTAGREEDPLLRLSTPRPACVVLLETTATDDSW